MRSETARWWRQATADLETAEVLLRGQRFYAVSYFVQQAVETTRYPEPDEETIPVDETTEADAVGDLETGRRVLQWIDRQLDFGSSQA